MDTRITVIGAGPGGYTAAFEAAKRGAGVTLVESNRLGGTCLNTGCIPTKTLRASADALQTVRNAKAFGIAGAGEPSADMAAIVGRKRKIIDTLAQGLERTCAGLGVRLVKGFGRVVNAHLVSVSKEDGSVEEIQGDKLILATGSATLNLPALPVDGQRIITGDEALELTSVPPRLLVVGGGVIGCELAFIYRAFGSKVTVVEGQDRLLPVPSVDEEMSRLIHREMKKAGIAVELCRTVDKAEVCGNGVVKATLGPSPFVKEPPTSAKEPKVLEAETLLVAVGRVPMTKGLGLAEAGIATDRRGYVAVDGYLATSLPDVYAIGDLLGPEHVMLAHMAVMEALTAVENCLGGRKEIAYDIVPSGIFASPEIADVGLTEAQARAAGYDTATTLLQFRELGKAQAMGALSGVFKLVSDRATGRLLGAHIAGAHATDLIAEAALALRKKATAADIANTIHAHPTLAEGMFEAARQLADNPAS